MRVFVSIFCMFLAGCVETQPEGFDDVETEPDFACRLDDCSLDVNTEFSPPGADAAVIEALNSRLSSMSEPEIVELVALSVGQVGCFVGWPSDDLDIFDYYDEIERRLATNLGLTPEELASLGGAGEEVLWLGLDGLAAQGRMVTVTGQAEQLIPRACVRG